MRLEGRTIDGKYLVGDLVAAGGMGQVYAARHLETERQVALKVLRGDSLPQPEAVERLRREARAAGRIGHDNICEVLDLGRLPDGTPYLVLPLLRGRTLAAALRDAGPLPLPRVLDIGAQILAGLAAAHDAGIVHRDLKPENVFLVRMGDRDDFVKILDFGISKTIQPTPDDGSLTQTGTVLGTPHYMAPEQVRGRKDLDHRVDLYAAGVLLYQMTTARLPFTGGGYSAIVSAILLDPFPPPRSLRPDLPEALEAVILRAMSRDRNDRFPDAGTMRRALLDARPSGAARAEMPAEPTQPAPVAFGDTGRGDSAPSAPTPPTDALHSVSTGSTAARRAESPRSRRRARVAAALAAGAALAAAALFLARSPAGTPAASPRAAAQPDATPPAPPRPATAHAGAGTPRTPARPLPATAASPSPPRASPSPPRASPLPPPASPAAPATPAATTVEIRLDGLPPGAAVRLDGVPVRGPVLRLPRAEAPALVEVSAPGFRDWRERIPRGEDRTVAVRMTRVRAPADAGPRDAAAPDSNDARSVRPGAVPDYSLGP